MFFIPLRKFFKKPARFKMYADFTKEDEDILINKGGGRFREVVESHLRRVAYYEKRR